MTERRSPTGRRRRLSTELKKFREAKGLTAAGVEKHFGWSTSKVSRIENNSWTRPNLRDVNDLLDLYGVTDPAVRSELEGWARDARQKTWWSEYKDQISPNYSNYIGLEAEASRISSYHTQSVAGLLQVPEYTTALMANSIKALTPDAIEKRVEIRINRQEQLRGPNPLELEVVLDEAVLCRIIGGKAVMAAQVKHILTMADLPNVTVYVLPFDAGNYSSTHGAFSILEFPDPRDRNAVNIETLTADMLLEDDESVRMYGLALRGLVGASANQDQSKAILRRFEKLYRE